MSYGNQPRGIPQTVQKILDENAQLIQAIVDYQNKGKAVECVQYQQLLHKNLVYLASLADTSQNIQSLLPPPPAANQIPGNSSGPSAMNMQGNPQERRPNPMDQNPAAAMPNMMAKAMTSDSMIPSGMHSVPTMTTSGNMTNHVGPYGSVNLGVQSMAGTPPVMGYSASANQPVGQSMQSSNQSMLPGQRGYMPGVHPTQTHPMSQHPQGQQFMIQQNVPMGTYNRVPVQQMHPAQQAQQLPGNQQPYMPNQTTGSQQTPGMVPYQQSQAGYDPYNHMQHVAGYNNPYAAQ